MTQHVAHRHSDEIHELCEKVERLQAERAGDQQRLFHYEAEIAQLQAAKESYVAGVERLKAGWETAFNISVSEQEQNKKLRAEIEQLITECANREAILRDLIRAWDAPSAFPPQDVADLMGALRTIVERARSLHAEVEQQASLKMTTGGERELSAFLKLEAEVKRLRAWAEDEQHGRHKAEEDRMNVRSEIEQLKAEKAEMADANVGGTITALRAVIAEIEQLQNKIKNCPPASESEYVRRLEDEVERLTALHKAAEAQEWRELQEARTEIKRLTKQCEGLAQAAMNNGQDLLILHPRHVVPEEAEIKQLRAAATEIDRHLLVIESAVRNADPSQHSAVLAALQANRAALERKP